MRVGDPENTETPPGTGEVSNTATRMRRVNLPQVLSRGGGNTLGKSPRPVT
jgi:hypothetical protein